MARERCMMCGTERDEEMLREFVKDMGYATGAGDGKQVVRVRFCADREPCRERAGAIERRGKVA